MDTSESEQRSQRRSSTARGSTGNFRPRVEAREAEDGRRLHGFYTSEADEEIRGVGLTARGVSEDGDRTLGFCKSEAKEEICSVGFAK